MHHTDSSIHPRDLQTGHNQTLTDIHRTLGIAGLMPFIGLSLAVVSGAEHYSLYLLSYAALILSFLGGVLWSVSLNRKAPRHLAWISVSVMLWAWSWLHPQFPAPLLLASASFIGLHLYERYSLKALYPEGFMVLRSLLTVIASSSLLVAGLWGG